MVAADDSNGNLLPPFGKLVVEPDRLEERVNIRVFRIGQAKRGCRMEACLSAHDRTINPGLEPEVIVTIDTEDKRPLFCH